MGCSCKVAICLVAPSSYGNWTLNNGAGWHGAFVIAGSSWQWPVPTRCLELSSSDPGIQRGIESQPEPTE
jgi:hypothetical protein